MRRMDQRSCIENASEIICTERFFDLSLRHKYWIVIILTTTIPCKQTQSTTKSMCSSSPSTSVPEDEFLPDYELIKEFITRHTSVTELM
jgi:hypothetical protein